MNGFAWQYLDPHLLRRVIASARRGLSFAALTGGMTKSSTHELDLFASSRREVVLITHAETDGAFQLAQQLMAAGGRVVVTARFPSSLTRILLGRSSADVIAVAADVDDQAQWRRLMQSAQARFGPIARIVDGRDTSHAAAVSCTTRACATAVRPSR